MLADATLMVVCFLCAMFLRLESFIFFNDFSIWMLVIISVIITLFLFFYLGLYQSLVRYITEKILIIVAKGSILSSGIFILVGVFLNLELPIFVPIVYGVFLFLSVGGLRFVLRKLFRGLNYSRKKPVIIYGSGGTAGLQLLNSLLNDINYLPVALVDEDLNYKNLSVCGLKVFPPSEIPQILKATGAEMVLLAVPDLTRAHLREIVAKLEDLHLEIKTIPSMSEIINGKAKISELRAITPEDMLGRDPVLPDLSLLKKNIFCKAVMVTGAGGSIGSELCREILKHQPKVLILFEISEFALYQVENELWELAKEMHFDIRIIATLGSVMNEGLLQNIIQNNTVNTIYHAAAYKHVPLVEENMIEGIRNNVFGTLTVSSVAKKNKVDSFILVSTDKAVRPTNIMGATKRISELICQGHAKNSSHTIFSMVRFGNVLGSSGSVIPKFLKQIKKGGPVTVTHLDVERYFMTIPEAAQLVIQAGAMAIGGDVFVLDMGKPVKILDLAISMIKLHGLNPRLIANQASRSDESIDSDKSIDIDILVTGMRKGEKLFEELLIGNSSTPTSHPRILTASEMSLTMPELSLELEKLTKACECFDYTTVYKILKTLPISYNPQKHDSSNVTKI